MARPQEEREGAGGQGHLGHPSAGPVHRLGRFSVGPFGQSPGFSLASSPPTPAGWTGRRGRGQVVRLQPLAT